MNADAKKLMREIQNRAAELEASASLPISEIEPKIKEYRRLRRIRDEPKEEEE